MTKSNDSIDMSTQNFYVLNRENNVYVCINNNGGLFTEEPTGTDTDDLSLGDGYVWKFMYTVPNDKLKFLDSKTIPIVELKTYDNESAPYSDAGSFNTQHKKMHLRTQEVEQSLEWITSLQILLCMKCFARKH